MRGPKIRSILAGTASVMALSLAAGPMTAQEAEDVFVSTGEETDVEDILPAEDGLAQTDLPDATLDTPQCCVDDGDTVQMTDTYRKQ